MNVRSVGIRLTGPSIAVFLAIAFAVYLSGDGAGQATAQAQDGQADTSANVQSSNQLFPVIECKWELPDYIVGFEDGTYPQDHSEQDPLNDPDIPYGFNIPDGAVQYGQDDDVSTVPDGDNNPNSSGNQVPCNRDAGPTDPPSQLDGARHMVQVLPVAEDDPEERIIQNWAAVDHPAGPNAIDDVYWKIFHADGSFKYQVHGQMVPVEDVDLLGSWNDSTTMWGAAYITGQVSQTAIHDADYGMIDRVKQRQKSLWYADWLISKDQMCGEYRIEAHAVAGGAEAVLSNTIDIICFYNLEIDFSSVNWGAILPGTSKVVPGDTQFSPPNSSAPTVKNTGNSGMQVGVLFTPLVQQNVQGPKQIVDFDAAFGKSASVLEWLPQVDANTEAWFSNSSINQVLCNNEVGKLDLSVHPPAGLPNGSYAGEITVLAQAAPDVCPDDTLLEVVAGVAVTGLVVEDVDLQTGFATLSETIEGTVLQVIDGPASLSGALMSINQSSVELFSQVPIVDPSTVVALDGVSTGTFAVLDPGDFSPLLTGSYSGNVSNNLGCQFRTVGSWQSAPGSPLEGGGGFDSCLNFDGGLGTFAGTIAIYGVLN